MISNARLRVRLRVLVFSFVAFIGAGTSLGFSQNLETWVEQLTVQPATSQLEAVHITVLFLRSRKHTNASLALLPGGRGWIGIREDGNIRDPYSILVRSRKLFASRGFLVAIVDASSDMQNPEVGLDGARASDRHARRLAIVLKRLRALSPQPVFVVGNSRGTISASNVGVRTGPPPSGPDGIVLVAPVTRGSGPRPLTIVDTDLMAIRQPILFVYHKDDRCNVAPPEDVLRFAKQIIRVTSVNIAEIVGGVGVEKGKDPCGNATHHGFNEAENSVVNAIANWIENP